MKIVAIIPAHLASVRFPRKILFPINGLPMIEHVRRRALLSGSLEKVIVATCDNEIAEVVSGYGGEVIMTAQSHSNGTSRVAEAAADVDCSHVMLLQGDEPLLLPRHIDTFASVILAQPNGDAWNATGPIENEEELDRHSFVKCAVSPSSRMMYCFRRSPCYGSFDKQKFFIRKVLGIIAFRKDFLMRLTQLSPSLVEQSESIEQMRILENGYSLDSVPVSPSLPSVNEPSEVDIVTKFIHQDNEQIALFKQIFE